MQLSIKRMLNLQYVEMDENCLLESDAANVCGLRFQIEAFRLVSGGDICCLPFRRNLFVFVFSRQPRSEKRILPALKQETDRTGRANSSISLALCFAAALKVIRKGKRDDNLRMEAMKAFINVEFLFSIHE